ncbi:MAG: hypothetical protein U0904_07530 [Candidatus Nanopelagicales bacterium]|nr:hypothetical protein [Candidatus Nanopelagicales bacterium]
MTATSWRQARRIATDMDPGPAIQVGLTSAIGRVLAQPVAAMADLPPFDAADHSGWAVSGVGPWIEAESPSTDSLRDGEAVRVGEGSRIPSGCTAVLADECSVLEESARHLHVLVGDAAAAVSSRRPGFIEPGTGVRLARSCAGVGDLLLKAGTTVSAGTVALAAAAGCDELTVIPPASIATVVLSSGLLSSGPPRRGKDRDVLAPLVPAWAMSSGGRCLPDAAGAKDAGRLANVVDSAGADIVVITSSGHPGIDPVIDVALRRLNAEILIDELAARPAGPVRLAELRDGRRVLALPREPGGAVIACALLLNPMIYTLAGQSANRMLATAMLRSAVGDSGTERSLPVVIERGELADLAQPHPWLGPHGLGALGSADGLAFVDAGRGLAGECVSVIRLPGIE